MGGSGAGLRRGSGGENLAFATARAARLSGIGDKHGSWGLFPHGFSALKAWKDTLRV